MGGWNTGWSCDVCGKMHANKDRSDTTLSHHVKYEWKWFSNGDLGWDGENTPDMCVECIERYPKIFADFKATGTVGPK